MSIKKIPVDQVKIGMYINKLDASWISHPFLYNSFIISTEKDLDKLLKSKIQQVYIDTKKGFYGSHDDGLSRTKEKVKNLKVKGLNKEESKFLEDKTPLPKEAKVARRLYANTKKVIENVFDSVKRGKAINWDHVFKCVDAMTESVLKNKDAFLNLSVIKDHDNYTFYHSLNVCCLCLTMGRYLLFPKDDLMALGVGALLHDIGKIRIPQSILNKPGRLTGEEFSIVKKHPETALEMLSVSTSLRWDSILLAYEHHERFDGSGYPHGLKGSRINQFAAIAAIADVFDAVTTDRPYRRAMSLDVAIRMILEGSDKDFATPFALKFAQCMGIYPISTLVELNSGEICLVASINHVNLERPKLINLYNSKYRKLPQPKVIDLASDEYNGIYIKRCIDAKAAGIEIDVANLLENVTV